MAFYEYVKCLNIHSLATVLLEGAWLSLHCNRNPSVLLLPEMHFNNSPLLIHGKWICFYFGSEAFRNNLPTVVAAMRLYLFYIGSFRLQCKSGPGGCIAIRSPLQWLPPCPTHWVSWKWGPLQRPLGWWVGEDQVTSIRWSPLLSMILEEPSFPGHCSLGSSNSSIICAQLTAVQGRRDIRGLIAL